MIIDPDEKIDHYVEKSPEGASFAQEWFSCFDNGLPKEPKHWPALKSKSLYDKLPLLSDRVKVFAILENHSGIVLRYASAIVSCRLCLSDLPRYAYESVSDLSELTDDITIATDIFNDIKDLGTSYP